MTDTYIVSEIGINHDGVVDKAFSLIDASRSAGATAVKFQYRNNSRTYLRSVEIGDEILSAEISKTSLNPCQYLLLAEYAISHGLEVGISFFTVDDVDDFNITDLSLFSFFKLPSPEFLNSELLDKLLALKKPVLCSTGAHEEHHIKTFIQKYKCFSELIVLLHCVSNYPLENSNSRLGYIKHLARIWPGKIGYSSHDINYLNCLLSVALGASVIERHITLSKIDEGLDHSSSSSRDEFHSMVKKIRQAEFALQGDGVRFRNQGELLNLQNLGRSFYAKTNLKAGCILQKANLVYRMPRVGISVDSISNYLGKQIYADVQEGMAITESVFKVSEYKASEINSRLKRKFNSKVLLPSRLHDLEKIRDSFKFTNFELHFSFQELNKEIDFFLFMPDDTYSIHLPDYINPTTLIDPFSTDRSIQRESISILETTVELATNISSLTGKRVPIVASFSQYTNVLEFFSNIEAICVKYTTEKFALCMQNLPPFAWYFGGSVKTNVFDSMDCFESIVNRRVPLCLDLSHLIMSCNYYGYDIVEIYELISNNVIHQHIAGAIGVDGEGASLAKLSSQENMILNHMLNKDVYSVVEVWQGHLDNFKGFKSELQIISDDNS